MTAVEWLVEQLPMRIKNSMMGEIEQAKAMEKEQIINAASDHCYPTCESARIDAEQYFNETFNKSINNKG